MDRHRIDDDVRQPLSIAESQSRVSSGAVTGRATVLSIVVAGGETAAQ